ncbi:unnamed protein product [Lampetra fluviatilis]
MREGKARRTNSAQVFSSWRAADHWSRCHSAQAGNVAAATRKERRQPRGACGARVKHHTQRFSLRAMNRAWHLLATVKLLGSRGRGSRPERRLKRRSASPLHEEEEVPRSKMPLPPLLLLLMKTPTTETPTQVAAATAATMRIPNPEREPGGQQLACGSTPQWP